MSASISSSTAAAYTSVWWATNVLWWALLSGVFILPLAVLEFQMGGWATAAIWGMVVSLALLAYTEQLKHEQSCSEGRPCTRSRILRGYILLFAAVIPVLGYISGGWLDGSVDAIFAFLVSCCLYRADLLRHWNATEARVDPCSRENVAIATAEGSSTLQWVLSLGMIKWGGATALTKRIFWLFIVLIAILTGLVAYACQHLPARQQAWPIIADVYAVGLLVWFCQDVNAERLLGDRFF